MLCGFIPLAKSRPIMIASLCLKREVWPERKYYTVINLGLFFFSLTWQKSPQTWEFRYFGVELWGNLDRELETVEWENLVVNKGVCGLVGRRGGRQTSAILTSFPNSRIDSRSRNCLHSWIPPPPYSPTTLSNDSWLDCGLGRVGLSLARIPKSLKNS